MSTVQNIKLGQIDPNSSINVRRHGVDENVEKVKVSIQAHGYWPDAAIVVRPHPEGSSQYDYEHVTGQCRFKACLDLGLEEIPAFVFDLSDSQAIQRSWLENEARGDLPYSDRAYWTERIYKQFSGDGYTSQEALQEAANFLGVSTQTARSYYALVDLPEDLKEMVDQGNLTNANAIVIARNTLDNTNFEGSQERMRQRVSWLLGLNREAREHALKALQNLGNAASIEDLDKEVVERVDAAGFVVEYAIPRELHGRLMEWGKERGLNNETAIIGHMIANTLVGS